MSQLNVDTIKKADGTGNLSVPAETGTVVTTASPSLGRRNLIINGAMQVDQRGQTFTNADNDAGGAFLADRFSLQFQDGASSTRVDTANVAVTDHPEGFRNACKVVCSTADDESDDTNVYCSLVARSLEKQDIAHLEWGTSGAKQVTMSFWVKSGVTGTYILTAQHGNGSNEVKYHKAYTIDSADTWEKKTITIDGAGTGLNWDTASDNTAGFGFNWWLACTDDRIDTTLDAWFEDTVNTQGARSATGQVNFFLTQDAEFLLTGVQLEVGDTATPFEHRSFGEELAACQRYYEHSYSYGTAPGASTTIGMVRPSGSSMSDSSMFYPVTFKVAKRSAPTMGSYMIDGTSGSWYYTRNGQSTSSTVNWNYTGTQSSNANFGVGSAWVVVTAYGHWTADAEL